MSRTANLRRQHDAAAALVDQIAVAIDRVRGSPNQQEGYAVALLTAKLTGTLRMHFAAEDKSLYPALMASKQAHVACVARRFFEEMGQIGPLFADYSVRWGSPSTIMFAWPEFCAESAALFTALRDRISREDAELYPLADNMAGADPTRRL